MQPPLNSLTLCSTLTNRAPEGSGFQVSTRNLKKHLCWTLHVSKRQKATVLLCTLKFQVDSTHAWVKYGRTQLLQQVKISTHAVSLPDRKQKLQKQKPPIALGTRLVGRLHFITALLQIRSIQQNVNMQSEGLSPQLMNTAEVDLSSCFPREKPDLQLKPYRPCLLVSSINTCFDWCCTRRNRSTSWLVARQRKKGNELLDPIGHSWRGDHPRQGSICLIMDQCPYP